MEQKTSVKSLLAIAGMAALAVIAAWQFYLFVSFKNAQGAVDLHGGTMHLWLAIGIALIVCVAAFFLFSKFLRYDARNEIHITSAGPPLDAGRTTKDVL